MCCGDLIFNIVYLILLTASLIASVGALFTSAWQKVPTDLNANVVNIPQQQGLFAFTCVMPVIDAAMGGSTIDPSSLNSTEASSSTGNPCDSDKAKDWFEYVAIAAILAAVIIQFIGVLYATFTLCIPCCSRILFLLFIVFAVLSTLLLLVALVVYGTNFTSNYQNVLDTRGQHISVDVELGYSFYMLVAANCGCLLATFLAIYLQLR